MEHVPKKESEEKQQEAEMKIFQFHLNSELYLVTCNTSMTVLDALYTNYVFKTERNKPKNKDKAVLLLRSAGSVPRAAIKTDFPCCLIEHNETLDVTFITNDVKDETSDIKPSCPSNPDTFVTFYVKKMGGDKVKYLLKSKVLRDRVEYVCVHAHKDDKLKKALKRDGRFTSNLFKKDCALSEFGTDSRRLMLQTIQNLNKKVFRVIVLGDKPPESQDDETPVKTETVLESDADVGTSQNPDNTEQTSKPKKETVKSTSAKLSDIKVIPNSEEILKILRNQFEGLMKQLKKRENLKNQSEVQKLFRGEFAKSINSFLEVKTMKEIAKLSDSVCQIRVNGEPIGTGFLFFDRFILTNGHVINPFASPENPWQSYSMRLCEAVKTVFNFEDYQSQPMELSVRTEICAFAYDGSENSSLDYALLELEADAPAGVPELLFCHSYSPPRAGGQVCIVGHPGVGVKKVDPCVIVDLNKQRTHYTITEQYFGNRITYDSCFTYGSSGSPVLDKDGYLIGIHTGYFTHNGRVVEYAHPMQPILENIRTQTEKKKNERISKLLIHLDQQMDISS